MSTSYQPSGRKHQRHCQHPDPDHTGGCPYFGPAAASVTVPITSLPAPRPAEPAPSPFDSIRQARPDGSEFWSARNLQGLLGYTDWRNFAQSIARARQSVINSEGVSAGDTHFVGVNKMVSVGSGTQRAIDDVELTRFAAYLVAMNGDPRKPEIAAAQTYFAVKTREAEIARPAIQVPQTLEEALVLALAQTRELNAAQAQLTEQAPKVAGYDAFLSADNAVLVREVAKILRSEFPTVRARDLYPLLVRFGYLIRRTAPCGQAVYDVKADYVPDHFLVIETVVPHNHMDTKCVHLTPHVTSRGVDLIHKRLRSEGF